MYVQNKHHNPVAGLAQTTNPDPRFLWVPDYSAYIHNIFVFKISFQIT